MCAEALAGGSTGDQTNAESDVESSDVVGDVDVLVGRLRGFKGSEMGVAGLDHGGRSLAVPKKEECVRRLWRDMNTPAADAHVFCNRLTRGWKFLGSSR